MEKRAAFNQVKVSNAMKIQVGTCGAAFSSAHAIRMLKRAQELQLDKGISMEIEPAQSASKQRNSTCLVVLATTPSAEKEYWNILYLSLKKSGRLFGYLTRTLATANVFL